MKTIIEIINSVKDPVLKGNLLATVPVGDHNKPMAGLRLLLLSFSWSENKHPGFDYWADTYVNIVNGQVLTSQL